MYYVDTIEKKVGDEVYTFECQSRGNRSGFVHEVELYKKSESTFRPIAVEKRQYYNRTWESYKYQSAMLGCVQKIKDRILNRAIDMWKEQNGKKRIMKQQKEAVLEAAKETKEYLEADELYNLVYNAKYGTEHEREYLESLDRALNLIQAIMSLTKEA